MNNFSTPQAALPGSVLLMLLQRAQRALQPLVDAELKLRSRRQRARELDLLANLDDHLLKDIGVTRSQIGASRRGR